VNHLLTEFYCH